MRRSGLELIASPPAPACPLPGSPNARASIPQRSTNRNASRRKAARWPSTESIAKSLAATNITIDQFVSLMTDKRGPAQPVPLIGFAQAGAGGYFDDGGFPVGKGWDEISFPSIDDEHAYALEVSGDSMEPAYRDGTVIVVSPRARRCGAAIVSW